MSKPVVWYVEMCNTTDSSADEAWAVHAMSKESAILIAGRFSDRRFYPRLAVRAKDQRATARERTLARELRSMLTRRIR